MTAAERALEQARAIVAAALLLQGAGFRLKRLRL